MKTLHQPYSTNTFILFEYKLCLCVRVNSQLSVSFQLSPCLFFTRPLYYAVFIIYVELAFFRSRSAFLFHLPCAYCVFLHSLEFVCCVCSLELMPFERYKHLCDTPTNPHLHRTHLIQFTFNVRCARFRAQTFETLLCGLSSFISYRIMYLSIHGICWTALCVNWNRCFISKLKIVWQFPFRVASIAHSRRKCIHIIRSGFIGTIKKATADTTLQTQPCYIMLYALENRMNCRDRQR